MNTSYHSLTFTHIHSDFVKITKYFYRNDLGLTQFTSCVQIELDVFPLDHGNPRILVVFGNDTLSEERKKIGKSQ